MGNVVKKMSFIVLAGLALSACSDKYSSSGESLYLQSRNGVKVAVPYPLTTENMSSFYDLPLQTQDARIRIAPPGG